MRCDLRLTALLFWLAAEAASAGAWPREQGTVFVSVSQTASTGARTLIAAVEDIRSFGALYAEYGLTERLTIGVDAGFGTGSDTRAAGGLVFLRHPVWSGRGGHRVAAELGFGLLDEAGGTQTRLRPGLAWGTGFESRWGGGWLGIEASYERRQPSGDAALKADLTGGLRPSEDWMLILQVQSGRYPGAEPIVRLAPSVVRRIGARSQLQLGLIAPLAGDDAIGAKLSAWVTF